MTASSLHARIIAILLANSNVLSAAEPPDETGVKATDTTRALAEVAQPASSEIAEPEVAQPASSEIAEFLAGAGEAEIAIDLYAALWAKEPDDLEALTTLVDLCMRVPACAPKRETLLRAALQRLPNPAEIAMELASLLLAEKRAAEATDVLGPYVTKESTSLYMWELWMQARFASGADPAAVAALERAVRQQSRELGWHLLLIDSLRTIRAYARLDAALMSARKDHPDSAQVWVAVGERALDRGACDEAREALHQARQCSDAQGTTLADLAELRRDIDQHESRMRADFHQDVIWSQFQDDLEPDDDY